MRISNIEWLKKRIGFIRKLGEQTARQRQIIDLIDNEAGLTEQERKLLHVLATAEKTTYRHRRANENRRSRNESREKTTTGTQSPALSRGWATDRSRTGRHKTGELCYKKTGYYRHLRNLSTIWRHPQTQTRKCLHPCSDSLVLPRSFARYARS